MAKARQAAAIRVAIALAAVTDLVKIKDLDTVRCTAQTEPPDALDKTFKDNGVDDSQLPHFRQILANLCPEIKDNILNPVEFPLLPDMALSVVVAKVESLLLTSPNWSGQCLPG